jgi:hypothetical protein
VRQPLCGHRLVKIAALSEFQRLSLFVVCQELLHVARLDYPKK